MRCSERPMTHRTEAPICTGRRGSRANVMRATPARATGNMVDLSSVEVRFELTGHPPGRVNEMAGMRRRGESGSDVLGHARRAVRISPEATRLHRYVKWSVS
jgi:hypothetical protein